MISAKLRLRNFCKKCFFLLWPKAIADRKMRQANNIEKSGYVLPYIEMRITTRCNMRCRKCGHLIPKYGTNAKDLPLDQFKSQFDKLVNSVSFIKIFSLVGGETMLSRYIYDILEYVIASDKIGEIRFISNAKVPPSDKLLRLISGTRVWIHFSVYPQNAHNIAIISELCSKYHVKHKFYDHGEDRDFWFDFGEVKRRHHSKRQLAYMSYTCLLGIAKQYCNGRLYLCPRINNAHELGLLEMPQDEILPITDDIQQNRRNIHKLYSMPFSHGCRYCNAMHARRIPPAEQID